MTQRMRFIFLLFLVMAPFARAESPAPLPAGVSSAPGANASAWRSLTEPARREILMAWKALPEATRPPFPVFRDTQIEKMLAPATAKAREKN